MIPMALTKVAAALGTDCGAGAKDIVIRRVTIDSRDVQSGDLFVAIVGERFDGHQFIAEAASKGAVACVCEHRWLNSASAATASVPYLAVPDTAEALGRLAAYYRRSVMDVATVVIAVTGTNGKTTTKCMIDHVLQACFQGRAAPRNFNNEIGVPLTLLSAEKGDRYLVVEIGTNHRGEVAVLAEMASPNAALITSIGEAHLEGLGNIENVAAEKASVLPLVRPDGLSVVNIDRAEIQRHLPRTATPRLITIGTDPRARLCVADVTGDIRRVRFLLDGRFRVELPMPGLHHATNAAATFAVARWFGMAPPRILDRLGSFEPPEGRTRVYDLDGVNVVDDAYNANPSSMAAAIEALARGASGRRVFVMGDMFELAEASETFHREAVQAVADAGIEWLVAVGTATADAVVYCRLPIVEAGFAQPVAESPDLKVRGTRVVVCEDAPAAERVLAELLTPGDTVWVKGSRAMQLDTVVTALRRRLDSATAVA